MYHYILDSQLYLPQFHFYFSELVKFLSKILEQGTDIT